MIGGLPREIPKRCVIIAVCFHKFYMQDPLLHRMCVKVLTHDCSLSVDTGFGGADLTQLEPWLGSLSRDRCSAA